MVYSSQHFQPAQAARRATARIAAALARALPEWPVSATAIRTTTALFGLAAVLVVVLAAATAGILWHFHAKALSDAEHQLRSLNGVLAEQTARSVKHVDFML